MNVVLFIPSGHPWGTVNLSPFCAKLSAFLRMAGVPHTEKNADIRAAPKGKVPFVSIDGEVMGDSQLIIERLTKMLRLAIDDGLTPEQHARGHVVRRMLEEATYFGTMHLRWARPETWGAQKEAFSTILPPVIGPVILRGIRRSVHKTLFAQGTGRHTREEIDAMIVADMHAVSHILADKPFLLGEQVRSFDATVFAFVDALASHPVASAPRDQLRRMANLIAYRDRVKVAYFSDVLPK